MSGTTRTRFPLSKPIPAHGDTVDHLMLREPNAGDLAAAGEVFSIGNMTEMQAGSEAGREVIPDFRWNMGNALGFFARLADVPRSSIAMMSMGDIYRLQLEVAGFFMRQLGESMTVVVPDETTTTTAITSSSPATGSEPASISHGSGDVIPPPSLRSVGRS